MVLDQLFCAEQYGENVVVGAESTDQDVPDNAVVVGNLAHFLRWVAVPV